MLPAGLAGRDSSWVQRGSAGDAKAAAQLRATQLSHTNRGGRLSIPEDSANHAAKCTITNS